MPTTRLVLLGLFVTACSPADSRGPADTLPAPHAAAIRDSVRTFLDAYAADVSAPPIGKKAREATAPFFAPEIVMSTDLGPEEPILIQTVDSLIPADEIVSAPPWIKSTRFEWKTLVITPLAPGLAGFAGKYAEHVTDTTGTVTELPGVQQGVVRNGPNGWRFLQIQSSHPPLMHQRQAELMARMVGTR